VLSLLCEVVNDFNELIGRVLLNEVTGAVDHDVLLVGRTWDLSLHLQVGSGFVGDLIF
jgi:hypothetical protein